MLVAVLVEGFVHLEGDWDFESQHFIVDVQELVQLEVGHRHVLVFVLGVVVGQVLLLEGLHLLHVFIHFQKRHFACEVCEVLLLVNLFNED